MRLNFLSSMLSKLIKFTDGKYDFLLMYDNQGSKKLKLFFKMISLF